MKHTYLLLLMALQLILVGSRVAVAQIPKSLDSLMCYLQTAPRDSAYLRAQNDAIVQLVHRVANYDRADSLARQQEALALKLDNAAALYEAYRNRALAYIFKADYPATLAQFQKALQVAESRNLPRKVIYGAMGNVVTGYDRVGQYEQVIQAALRAIRYQEQYDVHPRQAIPHRLIGAALIKLGRGQEAIPYYQKAGEIFRENGDPRGIAIFENQLADFYLGLKQPQRALPHYREALKMADEQKLEMLQFDASNGQALVFNALGKPAEGFPYARRAMALADKQQTALMRSMALGSMGLLYKTAKDNDRAQTYLKQALALAEKENAKEDARTYSQALADLYSQQQQYKLAFEFQSQKNRLIDSAITTNTNTEVQRLLVRFETEKKEARIKLLQQQAQLNQDRQERTRFRTNALLIGAALLLLLGGAISAWLLNRSKLRRLEEAQNLRKQIAQDLHDEVGSTLSSISMLSGHTDTLLSQNQPEPAQKMVQKIYTDARHILESIDEIIWTINPGNDSLQRIALRLQEYAKPLMESKQIQFSFQMDNTLADLPISMEVRRSLYLIGKEAINNLVKYSQATQATVRFEHNDTRLKVLIEDNGQGFDTSQPSLRTGQISMKQRAQAMGGLLEVQSVPEQGTRLVLTTSLA